MKKIFFILSFFLSSVFLFSEFFEFSGYSGVLKQGEIKYEYMDREYSALKMGIFDFMETGVSISEGSYLKTDIFKSELFDFSLTLNKGIMKNSLSVFCSGGLHGKGINFWVSGGMGVYSEGYSYSSDEYILEYILNVKLGFLFSGNEKYDQYFNFESLNFFTENKNEGIFTIFGKEIFKRVIGKAENPAVTAGMRFYIPYDNLKEFTLYDNIKVVFGYEFFIDIFE